MKKTVVQPLLFASPVYYPDPDILGDDVRAVGRILEDLDRETNCMRPPRTVLTDDDAEREALALAGAVPLFVPMSGAVQKRVLRVASAVPESLLWVWFPNETIFGDEIQRSVMRIVSKNALPAVADIRGTLRNRECRVGKVYDADSWKRAARLLQQVAAVRGARLLQIGCTQDWVASASVDTRKIEQVFGIGSMQIGLEELFREFESRKPDADMRREADAYVFGARECVEPTTSQVLDAFRIHRSIRSLMERHACTSVAVSCFSLVKTLGVTSCLALSMINDEPETTAACEGDLDSAVSMIVGKAVTGRPVFMGNPIFNRDNTLDIVHCTAPRRLVSSAAQPYEIRSHHETGMSVAQRVEAPAPAHATIFRIGNEFREAVVYEATLVGNPRLDTCRTQFRFAIDDWERRFDAAPGCHHLVAFGRHGEELRSLLDRFGIIVRY